MSPQCSTSSSPETTLSPPLDRMPADGGCPNVTTTAVDMDLASWDIVDYILGDQSHRVGQAEFLETLTNVDQGE